MLKKECTLDFKPTEIVECDPCRHYYFKRRTAIKVPTGIVCVTLYYDLRTCFQGLAKGDYLNSITLLPGEQIDLEVVRRHKYLQEIHEQSSIETEFENTFTETTRDKLSVTGEYSFTMNGEAGFEFLGLGAKVETEVSSSLTTFYERFKEIINETTFKVSRKYDFSIDLTSESETSITSKRRIRNPNNCHPVNYLVSQIKKKYKTELVLLKVDFDFKRTLPILFKRKSDSISVLKRTSIPFSDFFDRGLITLGKKSKAKVAKVDQDIRSVAIASQEVKELKKEELLQRIGPAKTKLDVKKLIESISKRDQFKPGVKGSYDYCVRTSDIAIETKISPCSACCEDKCE